MVIKQGHEIKWINKDGYHFTRGFNTHYKLQTAFDLPLNAASASRRELSCLPLTALPPLSAKLREGTDAMKLKIKVPPHGDKTIPLWYSQTWGISLTYKKHPFLATILSLSLWKRSPLSLLNTIKQRIAALFFSAVKPPQNYQRAAGLQSCKAEKIGANSQYSENCRRG